MTNLEAVEDHIDECCHLIRSHYPNITEDEIRWRDWTWVYARTEKILRDMRNEKRWQMQSWLLSVAAATNGGDSFQEWQRAFNTLYSPTELREMHEAEVKAAAEAAAKANAKKMEALLEYLQENGGLEQLLTGTVVL